MTRHICNVCHRDAPAGERCTNGRCAECHRTVCTHVAVARDASGHAVWLRHHGFGTAPAPQTLPALTDDEMRRGAEQLALLFDQGEPDP